MGEHWFFLSSQKRPAYGGGGAGVLRGEKKTVKEGSKDPGRQHQARRGKKIPVWDGTGTGRGKTHLYRISRETKTDEQKSKNRPYQKESRQIENKTKCFKRSITNMETIQEKESNNL